MYTSAACALRRLGRQATTQTTVKADSFLDKKEILSSVTIRSQSNELFVDTHNFQRSAA